MMYTLSDARTKLASYVGSSNTVIIDQKINDALERLLDGHDWKCLERQVRIQSVGNSFALPHNAEKILWCDVDGYPASVFGSGYQYLSGGPGDLDYRTQGGLYKHLVDLGDSWAIQYEAPKRFLDTAGTEILVGEYVLAAFTSVPGETGKAMTVFGNDARGEECLAGEPLPIQTWSAGAVGVWDASYAYSTFQFSHVSRVVKPVTTGYVSLYAVYPTTGQMFLLAKYHPTQTLPQFRRFRIVNAVPGSNGMQHATVDQNTSQPSYLTEGDDDVGTTSSILAVVRLRYVPLGDPADVLPVDSLQALRLAVMAVMAEEAKDFALARSNWADALSAMSGREKAGNMTKGTPVIIDSCYQTSMGRRMNRRLLL